MIENKISAIEKKLQKNMNPCNFLKTIIELILKKNSFTQISIFIFLICVMISSVYQFITSLSLFVIIIVMFLLSIALLGF